MRSLIHELLKPRDGATRLLDPLAVTAGQQRVANLSAVLLDRAATPVIPGQIPGRNADLLSDEPHRPGSQRGRGETEPRARRTSIAARTQAAAPDGCNPAGRVNPERPREDAQLEPAPRIPDRKGIAHRDTPAPKARVPGGGGTEAVS
jgi:hypothetical protein